MPEDPKQTSNMQAVLTEDDLHALQSLDYFLKGEQLSDQDERAVLAFLENLAKPDEYHRLHKALSLLPREMQPASATVALDLAYFTRHLSELDPSVFDRLKKLSHFVHDGSSLSDTDRLTWRECAIVRDMAKLGPVFALLQNLNLQERSWALELQDKMEQCSAFEHIVNTQRKVLATTQKAYFEQSSAQSIDPLSPYQSFIRPSSPATLSEKPAGNPR